MTEKEMELLKLYPNLSLKDIKELPRLIKENRDVFRLALEGKPVQLGPLGVNDLRIVKQILLNPLNLKRAVSSEVFAFIMGETPQNQPTSPFAIPDPRKGFKPY